VVASLASLIDEGRDHAHQICGIRVQDWAIKVADSHSVLVLVGKVIETLAGDAQLTAASQRGNDLSRGVHLDQGFDGVGVPAERSVEFPVN
jgi:hypothetical protein